MKNKHKQAQRKQLLTNLRHRIGHCWDASRRSAFQQGVATLCVRDRPGFAHAPQTWKEWCVDHGSRIGKTLAHIRTKYLEGFPDQFDVVVVPERSSLVNGGAGNYVYPVNYPAHYPAALAGTAHPNAGEPDLDTLAQFLSGVWVDMILHGKIKEPPKGTVLQTYGDDVSKQHTTQAQAFAINNASTWYVPEVEKGSVLQTGSPELPIYPGSPNEGVLPDSTQGGLFSAYQVMPMMDPTTGRVRNHVFAVKRDSINARTLCFVCGGRGHVARMDGKTCSTLEMGVEVPKSLLEATIYSDGVEYPKFNPKFKPRSDTGSHSRDRTQRAVVRVATPARRPSGYDSSGSRSKARVQEHPAALARERVGEAQSRAQREKRSFISTYRRSLESSMGCLLCILPTWPLPDFIRTKPDVIRVTATKSSSKPALSRLSWPHLLTEGNAVRARRACLWQALPLAKCLAMTKRSVTRLPATPNDRWG